MSRRKRIWRDIRDIHFQLNYETDPEVATFVHEFGSSSLARLIKNLLYQHLVSTAHPSAQRGYCTNTRIQALVQQLDPESRAVVSRAAGVGEAVQPLAVTMAQRNPAATPAAVDIPVTVATTMPVVSSSAAVQPSPAGSPAAAFQPVVSQEIQQAVAQTADPAPDLDNAPRGRVSGPVGQLAPVTSPGKPDPQQSQHHAPAANAALAAAAETAATHRHTGPNNKLLNHFLKD